MKLTQRVREWYARDRLPWLLALLALAVYLPASHWGIPAFTAADRCHAWGNDDLVPLAILADAHNSFVQPKSDWNTAYPWFFFGFNAALFAPYLGYLKLTGGLTAPSGAYPFGLTDPVGALTVMTAIGRSVSLLLSVTMVVAAYHIGKNLFDRTTGFLTGVIALLIYPVAFYARVGNPDATALGLLACTLAVLAACLRDGLTVRRGVWLAVFAALTFAAKEQHGAALMILIPFVWLAAFWQGPVETWRRWQGRWVAPVITAIVFIAVYLMASGAVVAPGRFARHMGFISAPLSTAPSHFVRYPFDAAGLFAQARDMLFFLVDALSWPLVVAAAIGIVLTVFQFTRRWTFVFAAVSYALLLLFVRFSHIHYVMPVALALAPFAAFAVIWCVRQGTVLRVAGAAVAVWGIGLLALQTIDLTHDMWHDSRFAASAWFRQHAPAGSKLVYFGSKHLQPNYAAGIVTVKEERPANALATILTEKPDYIVVNPDNTTFERGRVEWRTAPYSVRPQYLPADVFDQLANGALGYRLVAQFQSPRLMPWLNRPFLSYPIVNIPVQVFAREDRAAGFPALEVWRDAPHYPKTFRAWEITRERIQREFPGETF